MNAGNLPRRRPIAKDTAGKYIGPVARLAIFLAVLGWLSLEVTTARAETPLEWVAKEVPQLTQLYEALHRAPELSFQEEKTSARMADELRTAGLTVTEHVGGHGVV
ncbi:MAG: hypothetical protein IH898_00290, partial [Planctomycetes bacterium]|nr:hypothetical protein [Planctomycetota bacterium]